MVGFKKPTLALWNAAQAGYNEGEFIGALGFEALAFAATFGVGTVRHVDKLKYVNYLDGVSFDGALYRAAEAGQNPLDAYKYNVGSNHRYSGDGLGANYFGTGEHIVRAELGGSIGDRTMHVFGDQSLDNLLDLSNPGTRRALGVTLEDITRTTGPKASQYDLTQSTVDFASQSDYNGIIAPSARADGGLNVILFGDGGVK